MRRMHKPNPRVSRGRRSCYYCSCLFNWDDPTSDYYPSREHKQPKSRGGKWKGNVVLACRRCNNEKGDLTVEEYKEFLEVTKGCRTMREKRERWRKHTGRFFPLSGSLNPTHKRIAMHAVHYVRRAPSRTEVKTFCGKSGIIWMTDGSDAVLRAFQRRFLASAFPPDVTCKKCRKSLLAALGCADSVDA